MQNERRLAPSHGSIRIANRQDVHGAAKNHQHRRAFSRAANSLSDYNIFRIPRADHPLRIDKASHLNRDPAAVHEHEVRIPDQPEMVRSESLDEELFRVLTETEHFGVT